MSIGVTAVGLDFGTTNSAIAAAARDGSVALARFPSESGGEPSETMRSILFFPADPYADETVPAVGGEAIRRYLASGANGRLIQSLKSFLADRLFHETNIMGVSYSLEALIAPFLQTLREAAQRQFGELPARVIVGRPVHFSSAQNQSDDELAATRLGIALRRSGWKEVIFEYEPVAAAYHYAATLEREELCLVADFGGGTSDFSIVRLRPATAAAPSERYQILANDGVALAGDSFDGEMVRHLVVSALGRGSLYRSPYGRVLPAPTWFYSQLERWHYLSFLKASATMNRLRDLEHQALEPEKIRALIHIIENDLGYLLFKSVERGKLELSDGEAATLQVFRSADRDRKAAASRRLRRLDRARTERHRPVRGSGDEIGGGPPRFHRQRISDRRVFLRSGGAPTVRAPLRRTENQDGERVHLGGARPRAARAGNRRRVTAGRRPRRDVARATGRCGDSPASASEAASPTGGRANRAS